MMTRDTELAFLYSCLKCGLSFTASKPATPQIEP